MKILSMMDCSYHDAVTAWNGNFQDYDVNVKTDIDGLTKMMSSKRLSPLYSFIAYEEEQPIGIVLNSIQEVAGKKAAYNGGTAVHPKYRKEGVGYGLVHSSLNIYKKAGVDEATLEAISTNKAAISLYEKNGYHIKDRLHLLQKPPSNRLADGPYSLRQLNKREWLEEFPLNNEYPWQNQAAFQDAGEYYQIIKDDKACGRLVISREKKNHMTIFQLSSEEEYEEVINALCTYFPSDQILAFNIPESHPSFKAFIQAGFKSVLQQVWMINALRNTSV
ncbi:GNAT family N-acetyltransferase [Halobacillus sp. H74]|uniref:GNAT family N-acetyltransferase n=1 Tax=Halobacillus sp. H74 TaxID=3457436 RepID=UPI003FCC29A5